jgi:hypothetical protein
MAPVVRVRRRSGRGGSSGSLAELRELDLHAVAPAADLDRGLAHGAADGADVAVVFTEELDDALTEDAIFGAQAGDARREVGADGFGEVLEADLAGVGEGDGGAQGLLELADVEGPGVAEEGARRGAVERDALGLGGEAREDRGDEGAEVLAAVAQRGEDHLEAGEARVEVLAEAVVGDARRDVLVGRGDDADVDLEGVAGTDRADLAVLEDAEEGDLRFFGELGDLVEEERAAVGAPDQALALLVGAGERAAAMAEQLALDEVAREGAAVDRDECAAAAGGVVDRARDQLLAGAGLAADEDRDAGARDLAELIDAVLELAADGAERDRGRGLGGEIAIGVAVVGVAVLAEHEQGAAGLDDVAVGEGGDARGIAVDEDAVLGAEVGGFPAGLLAAHAQVLAGDLVVRHGDRGGLALAGEGAPRVASDDDLVETGENDPQARHGQATAFADHDQARSTVVGARIVGSGSRLADGFGEIAVHAASVFNIRTRLNVPARPSNRR